MKFSHKQITECTKPEIHYWLILVLIDSVVLSEIELKTKELTPKESLKSQRVIVLVEPIKIERNG